MARRAWDEGEAPTGLARLGKLYPLGRGIDKTIILHVRGPMLKYFHIWCLFIIVPKPNQDADRPEKVNTGFMLWPS